ncbi:hypothetical protein CYY_008893 [Polysphondylium violaceum]|uniref:Uncharacterized protein n=1 Tax=Polysphondylium violaceum TaxID=133409 RepID=A0A8J4PNN7_9MYCE|nr:hypothetical protein CYY_008893 [Polysphondylium violaceum]
MKTTNNTDITNEMREYFYKRTEKHINRVRELMMLMEGYETLKRSDLLERGIAHDQSKYLEPEVTGYIWLSWFHYCKNSNIKFAYPSDTIIEMVNNAVDHHLKSNLHHPESHSNINNMSTLDIVEMVCDWSAISQELNQGSCLNYI